MFISLDSKSISHGNLLGSRNGSRVNLPTPTVRQTSVNDTPENTSRLNSLSLIEPHPFPDMEVDLEPEIQPPPAKRARARYIFQNCLKSTQEFRERQTEVFAPDSEEDE